MKSNIESKVYGHCKVCGKTISVKENMFNVLMINQIYYFKAIYHNYKVHGKTRTTPKYLIKNIVKITYKSLFALIYVPTIILLVVVTYPFWWIHEKL